MKIRRKTKIRYISVPKPNPEDSRYITFEPEDYFEDSAVSKVYIKRSVIIAVMEWVAESKTLDPVPEVGGFILGNSWGNDVIDYEIGLELFVPSKNVKSSNPIRLNFGPEAMMELMEVQRENIDYKLLGWFHTHPGHKPYLSEQDMTIHENFFNKRYHIAIVLDSLTEDYVSVLVSRKRDGETNKSYDEKFWFAWKNLLK